MATSYAAFGNGSQVLLPSSSSASLPRVLSFAAIASLSFRFVGNRPQVFASLPVHCRWVALLEEEFFRQGDMEKAHNLPVSPLFDRNKPGITKSQVGPPPVGERLSGSLAGIDRAAHASCQRGEKRNCSRFIDPSVLPCFSIDLEPGTPYCLPYIAL